MQKISIIIPTYNSEKTIIRALESVFRQERLNEDFTFEVLICDDGSTDKTIEICSNYSVRILKNDRHTGGPNAGRNNGIRNATGDIIAFLDHDDEWLSAKTRVQLSKILSGYEFVYSTCLTR
jgi:glycosyltransferase involved in cell wall biosynthesis